MVLPGYAANDAIMTIIALSRLARFFRPLKAQPQTSLTSNVLIRIKKNILQFNRTVRISALNQSEVLFYEHSRKVRKENSICDHLVVSSVDHPMPLNNELPMNKQLFYCTQRQCNLMT